jgi:hypothetical protein
MIATHPLRIVIPRVPGKSKRINPSVSPLKNSDDQTVACDDTKQHRKDTTKAPKRLFSPHTPSDDAYHLGRMIYML